MHEMKEELYLTYLQYGFLFKNPNPSLGLGLPNWRSLIEIQQLMFALFQERIFRIPLNHGNLAGINAFNDMGILKWVYINAFNALRIVVLLNLT